MSLFLYFNTYNTTPIKHCVSSFRLIGGVYIPQNRTSAMFQTIWLTSFTHSAFLSAHVLKWSPSSWDLCLSVTVLLYVRAWTLLTKLRHLPLTKCLTFLSLQTVTNTAFFVSPIATTSGLLLNSFPFDLCFHLHLPFHSHNSISCLLLPTSLPLLLLRCLLLTYLLSPLIFPS